MIMTTFYYVLIQTIILAIASVFILYGWYKKEPLDDRKANLFTHIDNAILIIFFLDIMAIIMLKGFCV